MTRPVRHAGPAAAAILAVAVCAVAIILLTGGDGRYEVRAVLRDAAGLRLHSAVTIGGVKVGDVTELHLDADDSVTAVLRLDRDAAPIGRNARVDVVAKNLLGARLVSIEPGDRSDPAPSGTTVPPGRTGAPVDLDQVLSVLDPDTRTRLRIFVAEMGRAFTGRGADFARLVDALPSSLRDTTELVDATAQDDASLGRLVGEADRLLASVARERRPLNRLVDSATGALEATAARHRRLAATLAQAPSAIAQLRTTLEGLDRTARPLRPAAAALRRSAAPLTGVLRELPAVRGDAVSALGTARRVAPDLTRLADGVTPLVTRLRPTAIHLDQFAEALDPVSSTLDSSMPDVLGLLEGWTRAIQTRDAVGHVFRGSLTLDHELSESLVDGLVRPAGRSRRKARGPSSPSRPASSGPAHAAPAPERPTPARPGPAKPLVPHLPDLKTPAPVAPVVQGVDKLLNYLLGR